MYPSKVLIGSQTKVTITGSGFVQDKWAINGVKINNIVIEPQYVDSEKVIGELPDFSHLTSETTYDIEVTMNLQDFYPGLRVTYVLAPELESFEPKFSNSHEQYFSVNVTGNNFLHSSGLR